MNILDRIVIRKKEEVALAKQVTSTKELEASLYFQRPCFSLKAFIFDPQRTGIIAEFKRRSPSKGIINDHSGVAEVTQAYAEAGASALSVLTDRDFFGGSQKDLLEARQANQLPILRKDFIVDEYQILEAKAWGADVILLIAAILTPVEIGRLAHFARQLGLNVLLEVHNQEELERSVCEYVDAVGVNNRNLNDFSVDIQTSFHLAPKIPSEMIKISESAISSPESIIALKKAGFNGFLIGESFMKSAQPGEEIRKFVSELISV